MKDKCTITLREMTNNPQSLLKYLVSFLLVFSSYSCLAVTIDTEQRKVVLIGIDGLNYETLKKVDTPNFDRLKTSTLFTGGLLNTAQEQKTSSGPGWTTTLTGVWANKHKVTRNDKKQKSQVPSIFSQIHNAYPSAVMASVVRWDTIYANLQNDMSFVDHKANIKTDDSDAVVQFINFLEKRPDFSFLHLDDVDHAGHYYGFGKEYEYSISNADLMLGEILDAIKTIKGSDDNYLIIVTTDHGRNKSGRGHGKQSISERTTFYATNDDFYHKKSILETQATSPQTYIVESILDYLQMASQQ